MNPVVLVTGATGFIGSHLLPRLAAVSKIRCLVKPESFHKIKTSTSVEVVVGDLASTRDFEPALKDVKTVVHLAAQLRKMDPKALQKVNVEGTRCLVQASKKNAVKHFIYVSTENALREDLHDAYAETKREAENIVRTFPGSLILRPCFVYGQGDHHGLGRLFHMVSKSVVVPLFGGLQSKIQPVYVDDMVEYLLRAVKNKIDGEYTLAGVDTITMNDFLKKALSVGGFKKKFVSVPRSFYYLAAILGDAFCKNSGWGIAQFINIYYSRTYSIEKTTHAFDYSPRSLEEGLKAWLG